MQVLERTYNQDPSRGDIPRDEERITVEVTVAADSGATVNCHRLKPGTHRIRIYRSELPEVMAQLRTPEMDEVVRRAKRSAERAKERWIDGKLGDMAPGPKRDMQRQMAEQECPIYWSQLEFLEPHADDLGIDMRGGYPPLSKVEVVSEDSPPATPENQARQTTQTMGAEIAGAIRDLLEAQKAESKPSRSRK